MNDIAFQQDNPMEIEEEILDKRPLTPCTSVSLFIKTSTTTLVKGIGLCDNIVLCLQLIFEAILDTCHIFRLYNVSSCFLLNA